MQKNTKPPREYEGPFTKNKRAPKKEYAVEGRSTRSWDRDQNDCLQEMLNHLAEWHPVRKYSTLKQAQQAVAALNKCKNSYGYEYRIKE